MYIYINRFIKGLKSFSMSPYDLVAVLDLLKNRILNQE